MELAQTSAIVTGGASGLGAATATALAERGASVVIIDVTPAGREFAESIGATFVQGDVCSPDDVSSAIAAASSRGPLRAVANIAGISRAQRTVSRDGVPFDLETFENVIRVNLIGTFNCVRLCAAAMARTEPTESGERGAILNTASAAAFDGQVGQAAYSASKGGIVGLTLPLARDLAALGIRVNTIAPGLFDTPIYGSGEKAETKKRQLGESVVFPRRLGWPEEFASLALELLTNQYLNGEVVRIDGALRLPPRSYA